MKRAFLSTFVLAVIVVAGTLGAVAATDEVVVDGRAPLPSHELREEGRRGYLRT